MGGTMIVNMIWHVLQKVVKCYFVSLPQLSNIYWPIHFNVHFAFLHYLSNRLVFSGFFYIRGNLGNAKEKPTRKTCFSREMKGHTLRIYFAKVC